MNTPSLFLRLYVANGRCVTEECIGCVYLCMHAHVCVRVCVRVCVCVRVSICCVQGSITFMLTVCRVLWVQLVPKEPEDHLV